ncbi:MULTISPECIES: carbohydrate ABC transporter permease [Lentzea]|uniref:Multiple sugar transport system permease protein n=1 Tax=Lentzea flaviverrucosa TaxID=200379 RepID=A0A1H9X5L2_9PSEU|nr:MULTISPECIES: carbohydrate ABC transporter permease [Lentzea]MCR3747508.1 multiple sugar transport system permease protein [Lentzea californiensis]RDI20806.1 carbohydrate ABC transporter membrane protein 2 (CUT1 family) [Lentzea flaviverrucosa]SES41445.1 multiple sugar transport system permease protein [Lentzea flaviverrucosa]
MTATLTKPPVDVPAEPEQPRRKRDVAGILNWVATHAIGLALGLMFATPVVFVFLTAVMSDDQAFTSNLWPREWHWENFVEVFDKAPLFQYLINSLTYSLLATLGMLISSIPAAYALAKLKWRGRNVAFILVIGAMMLPPQVVAVPLYDTWSSLGLTGTLVPLIAPYFLFDAFSIFLLRQFMLTIPQSYVDAARVDGCSEFQALVRIIIPMAKPGIAATALFCFLFTWNDYFGPLLYTGEVKDQWTLSLALATFKGMHIVQWNSSMAVTFLTMIPAVVLFVFAQKSFVKGITFTGVKG